MTFEEKQESLKLDRSLALNSMVKIAEAQADAQDEDDFHNKYLWGEGSFIGIMDLIKLYYQEKNLEFGRTYSNPTIANYTKTQWDIKQVAGTNVYGDTTYPATDGFYPQTEDGIGQQDFNSAFTWMNMNGENAETTGGLIALINTLDTAIGTTSTTGAVDSGYYDPNPVTVQADGNAARDARIGLGLRGKRTEDSEPDGYPDVSIAIDPNPPYTDYKYYFADGTIDDPDYYAGTTEKANLLSALLNLINAIKDGSTYRNKLDEIQAELDDIVDGTNTVFITEMKDYIITDDDSSALDTYKTALDTAIGTSGDGIGAGTLYGYYNWFNTVANGTEGSFDTYLTNLETLMESVRTLIIGRFGAIDDGTNSTLIGAKTSVANPGDPTQFTKMRKWRYFWIYSRLGKPKSSLITVESMDDAIANAQKQLDNANAQLAVLIGETAADKDQYIPTPRLVTVFAYHKRNADTGEITQRRIGIAYDGQIHATSYEIFRRPLSNVTVDNTEWGDTPLTTYTDIDTEKGIVKIIYVDETTINTGDMFCYRVRTRDSGTGKHDTFDSGSLESKIYDNTSEFVFSSITNGIVDIGADHGFSKGKYVAVKDTASSDGFYLITKVDENLVTLWPTFNSSSGKIYPTSSVIVILD